MIGIVYGLYNTQEDLWYIGSTQQLNNKRKNEHFSKLRSGTHENKGMQEAAAKYGVDSFEWYEIESVELNDNHLKLAILEEWYIKDFDSYRNGYNRTDNVAGSAMQSLPVRQQHWGELHGGSKYSNDVIEKVFWMLHNTSKSSMEIGKACGVDPSTVSYVKRGGHQWVHLQNPEASLSISNRIVEKEEKGLVYTNTQILQAFEYLVSNPTKTFEDVATATGVKLETVAAISSGRQYRNLIEDNIKVAVEYYSKGRTNFAKEYSCPKNIDDIREVVKYVAEHGYMSRDKIAANIVIETAHTVRLVLELDINTWRYAIMYGNLGTCVINTALSAIKYRPRASTKTVELGNIISNMYNNNDDRV